MSASSDDQFRRDRNPTKAATARLALLLVVAVVVGTAVAWLTRGPAARPGAQLRAGVTANATATAFRVHSPPSDRALLWLAAARDLSATSVRLRALDWNGREVGAEAFPCLAPCSFDASPDGQRVLVREQPAEGQPLAAAGIFDSAGRMVGSVVDPDVTWADDGRHLCTIHPITADAAPASPTAQIELDLIDPAAHLRHVVVALPPRPRLTPAGSAWQVLACSTLSNRVIAAIDGGAGLSALSVFELSTGRILYASGSSLALRCACVVNQLGVSHDGGVAIASVTSGRELLINLSTGLVTPSSLSLGKSGLSWNGGRQVIAIADDSEGIADVATGTVVWRAPHSTVTIIAVRPGTDDLAVQVSSPRSNGTVVIVLASGTQVDLPPSLLGP